MVNTRKRFFSGIIFLIIGEILSIFSITGLYTFFPLEIYLLTFVLASIARVFALGLIIAGLAIMFPCSKFIKRAFFLSIALVALRSAMIPLFIFDSVLAKIIPAIEFVLEIFIIYNSIDGIASYFDRLGDRDRFYLGGRIRNIVAFFIGVACVLSWLQFLPLEQLKTETAFYIISFSVAVLEGCGHAAYIYYLFRSCKRDF